MNKMSNKKIEWIEFLRCYACISIVLFHVIRHFGSFYIKKTTLQKLFNILILGIFNNMGVYCFIMISGYLILNPAKDISLTKIKKYIKRMVFILLIFGYTFCVCTNIHNRNDNIFKILLISFFDLIQGKTINHLWYIYMLIGLYILTPALKIFINNASKKTAKFILISLFILGILIPTINDFFHIKLTTFNLKNLLYIFIYLLGYYITVKDFINEKIIYSCGVIGIIGYIMIIIITKNIPHTNIFNIFESIMIFKIFSTGKIKIKHNKFIKKIAKYSFGVYLIHYYYLTLIPNFFKVYINNFPFIFGEILTIGLILAISYITSVILYKLPFLKKILTT